MTKATQRDRRRIGEWIKSWQKTLFLNDWGITACYPNTDSPGGSAARTDCSTRYFEASIEFYPCLFSEGSETQWRTVAHEMTHILLADMQSKMQRPHDGMFVSPDEMRDSVEHTTTRIGNILVSAWPHKK